MRPSRWMAPLLLAAPLGLAGIASATKPPAYTIHAGFSTSLRNTEGAREECLDAARSPTEACHERGGLVVAEGETTHARVKAQLKIKEHRARRDATPADLEALAKRTLSRAALGREIRLTAGKVGERAALEQWTLWDACEGRIAGRVFISLPDKVIEVEATAVVGPSPASVEDGRGQIDHILRGVRVRRVGETSIDPAPSPPSDEAIVDVVARGC